MDYGRIINKDMFDELKKGNGPVNPYSEKEKKMKQMYPLGYTAKQYENVLPPLGSVARGQGNFAAPGKKQVYKNNFNAGEIELRNGMNAVGLKNHLIGWNGDTGTVLYDGKAAFNPEINEGGVTKTSTGNFINGMNRIYRNQGIDDEIVAVNNYVSGTTGLANAVQYNDNGVNIGGIPIENVVISNGVSYAPRSAVTSAVNKYKQQSNIQSAMDMYGKYMDRNGKQMNDIERAINNYEDFSYDADKDPAYQEYKRQYTKNAQEAFDDTWGRQVGRTGGYANSAAMALSDQAYYDHMSQLDNVIPELMDKAYTRYRDKYDMLRDRMDMYGNPLTRYEMETNAQLTDRDFVQRAMDSAYQRYNDERNYNRSVYESNRDFEYNKTLDDWNHNYELSKYKDEQEKYWYNNAFYNLPAEKRTQAAWEAEMEQKLLDLQLAKDTYEHNVALSEIGVLTAQAQLAGLNIDNALKRVNAAADNAYKAAQTRAANASADKTNKETEQIGNKDGSMIEKLLAEGDGGGSEPAQATQESQPAQNSAGSAVTNAAINGTGKWTRDWFKITPKNDNDDFSDRN